MATISEENEVVKNEESIFTDDDFAVDIYNKRIKNAKIAILGCAIWILFSAAILYFRSSSDVYSWIDIALNIFFIAGFIFLYFWANKKPHSAIVCSLILLGMLIAIGAMVDISSLWSAIIIKIIIISTLVAGLSDAKDTQERMVLKNY